MPSIMQYFLLGIFILQCYLLGPVKGCLIFETPYGNLTGDQEVGVGSPFRIQCTLYESALKKYGVTSEQLIMKFAGKVLHNTTIIDHQALEYVVQNASLSDNGLYSCLVPIPDYEAPQLVCSSQVSVGYSPLDVTDFSCISYEYTNLTCTWRNPVNAVSTSYVLYDTLYKSDFFRFRRQCPVSTPTSCQFRLDTKPLYMQDQKVLYFIVQGNNSLGTSEQRFSINHFEIIKPGVPTSVQFSNVRETSMIVDISAPRGMQYQEFKPGLVYEITYHSISTLLDVYKGENVTAESGYARIVIENLVPNTLYDFQVRCHVNIPSENFIWSDAKVVNEVTRPDVPYLAPVIDSSSFDYQIIAGNRTISLYWRAVPSEFENGNGFEYIINYHEHYVPSRFAREASKKSNLTVKVGNKTHHSFEHMEMGTAFIFNIIAVNDEGRSFNETAVIVVDKAEKLLQGPKDITVISYGQGDYDVSWKTPDERQTNFTLFWCKALKFSSTKCEGPLNWLSIVNKTYHKLLLPNQETNYQFAVATTHNHQSSGMYWAPCTVIYGVPSKVRKVELIPKNSTSLRVRWSLKCEAEKKVVKEYAIHYCPYSGNCTYNNARKCKMNGEGPVKWPHVSIWNSSSTEHILGSLKPYTCYFSYVRVRTDAGWGENSDYALESTMQAAPDDSPTNVHVAVDGATIKVSCDPPTIPNGRISRYVIYYNKTSSDDAYYHKEIRVPEDAHGILPHKVTLDNVHFYTNYSIEVVACVDQACSPPSNVIYVSTGISYPGIISIPRVEVLETYINISWDPPLLPNGPVQYYEVEMEGVLNDVVNVTGDTFLLLDRKCVIQSNNKTTFKVRAVNLMNGIPLFGDYSGLAKAIICPEDYDVRAIIGGTVGGLIVAALAIGVAYYLIKHVKRQYNNVKNINIQLPKGLESPLDNPLNSYDKFKSGLMNNHDSGIPNDRAYDRLFSSTSDGDLSRATENGTRGLSGRNHSGESAVSGKCHTSISSANTTKTHNSMDSGAEVESPLSPDSFSSDSGSVNTTPRSFKPDLNIVDETNHLNSKDSGLEKEDIVTMHGLRSNGKWCEGWKGNKIANGHPAQYPGNEQNLSSMERCSLSNSEPSVVDFDTGNSQEQDSGMQSYSKFGYGRSHSHENLLPENKHYSKFGFASRNYKPLVVNRNCPQVFSSFVSSKPSMLNGLPLHSKKEDIMALKQKPAFQAQKEAYSKFGLVEQGPAPPYQTLRDIFRNSALNSYTPSQPTFPSLDAGVGASVRNTTNIPKRSLAKSPEQNGLHTEVGASGFCEDLASPPGQPDQSTLGSTSADQAPICDAMNFVFNPSELLPLDFDISALLNGDAGDCQNHDTGDGFNPETEINDNQAQTKRNQLHLCGGTIGAVNGEEEEFEEPIEGDSTQDCEGSDELVEAAEDELPGRVRVGYNSGVRSPNPTGYVSVVPNLTNVSVESV